MTSMPVRKQTNKSLEKYPNSSRSHKVCTLRIYVSSKAEFRFQEPETITLQIIERLREVIFIVSTGNQQPKILFEDSD